MFKRQQWHHRVVLSCVEYFLVLVFVLVRREGQKQCLVSVPSHHGLGAAKASTSGGDHRKKKKTGFD